MIETLKYFPDVNSFLGSTSKTLRVPAVWMTGADPAKQKLNWQ